jgi:hypothetical protein
MAFVAVKPSQAGSGELFGEVRATRYPAARLQRLQSSSAAHEALRHWSRADEPDHRAEQRKRRQSARADILPENKAMIALAKSCGMTIEHPPQAKIVIAHS